MYELKVKNNRGELLSLTSNVNYNVIKVEGLNPPQATINMSANATMDGSSLNATRLESRNLVLYVVIEGDVEANRIELYNYFPIKQKVTVYYTNGTRDVYIEGVVEVIECDIFNNKQVAQISLICPNPYFKDIDYVISNFSEISTLFEFPFSIDEGGVALSEITQNIRKSIINDGDVETGIEITLFATGTVVNPVIYDVMRRTHMRLNYTMLISDTVVINTNVGEKSIELIRNGVSSNLLGYLEKDSDWFTLLNGDNVFAYDAESGVSDLQLTFKANILYSGV